MACFCLQNLVEKIVRSKIYDALYWKEHCFALTAAGIIDKAVDLKCVGGTFGGTRRPTNFLCLILKMLQIQPDKEVIIEYIKNEDFKYVRLLGTQGRVDRGRSSKRHRGRAGQGPQGQGLLG